MKNTTTSTTRKQPKKPLIDLRMALENGLQNRSFGKAFLQFAGIVLLIVWALLSYFYQQPVLSEVIMAFWIIGAVIFFRLTELTILTKH